MTEKKYVIGNAKLMAEWNWERNNELNFDPETLTLGSGQKVWWKCSKGHEWQATIANRNNGNGCPYCAERYTITGENDLQTVNSILAEEWNYEKNNGLTPLNIMANSNKKVWWRCGHGHSWQAAVFSRTGRRPGGCPYCTGRKVLAGFNDLGTLMPQLAKEWDSSLNGTLTPAEVSPGSNKRVWWQCADGHVWQAAVYSRTRRKASGCPICAGVAKQKKNESEKKP